MDDLSRTRMQRELEDMKKLVQEVTRTADGAAHSISTHEQLCALRYENIASKLEDIPKIFNIIDSMRKHIYIGMGMVLVVGTLVRYIK